MSFLFHHLFLPHAPSQSQMLLTFPSVVTYSWMKALPNTFAAHNLSSIITDRRKFSQEIVTLLLDTWMMAAQEISINVLDHLGEGRGDVARGLIEDVGKNRGNTFFNLMRSIVVGQEAREGME